MTLAGRLPAMSAELDAAVRSASRYGARRVERDAIYLAGATVANAVLGMGFWTFAARFVEPSQLGVMTAVLSVITAVGSVISAGVGDAYTAVLPAVGDDRRTVYRRGQRLSAGLSFTAGGVAGLVTVCVLPEARFQFAVALLVAVGVFGWTALGLQSSTLIAIGRASWTPVANVAVGIGKIVLLPVAVFTVAWQSIPLAVVVAAVGVAVVLRPMIRRIVETGEGLPAQGALSGDQAMVEFHRVVTRTTALSGLNLGVLSLTPFLVTLFAGPAEGARFALVFAIVSTLDFIGASMAVSLVVHASGEPESAASMAKKILLRSGVVTGVGTIGLVVVVPGALHLLNPAYGVTETLVVVLILCAGSILRLPYLVWAALQQARRRLRAPLTFSGATAILLFALMPGLCGSLGAAGGAWAILLHQAALTFLAGALTLVTRRRRTSIEQGEELVPRRHGE
ncbi:hypothetical protein QEN40_13950 [Gordonia alkanivorans]|uniref:lipopolysaccharide biosynthesis protein n=2 Tax=Gordoniaceae TaxID=85026 RepID=UPI00111520B3|nr:MULTISPECIES: hypothetical protein [Gordonia]MDH3011675.1 hypothetical protein [Gordonia alkanivorans]MDH3042083.1 hypothetical protein [Gordonia alkanivorans]MDH3058548.1 hypothetical protein [Gordonia alkanivorans]